ncbi:hypothetical protein M2347_004190 [Chryseobacterium sp. H1D6B]|uniref:hypothetical protein n=1 Tax=Chryseobacterium sp. H1D6B TaxID=2940588 RepID=UPI0015C99347|nr:hypothetical protein [Chryseobacterium sp. H1D6B]MDH6254463.1 hypothetical protein [Chryseobacterium sp. H1D6B]
MKIYNLCLIIILIFTFISCNKNIYGTYNTRNSKDKSAFFQVKINSDNSIEKTEIHTIRDMSSGKCIQKNDLLICHLDSSSVGFPPTTITLKVKGKKIFFVRKGIINKELFLVKE